MTLIRRVVPVACFGLPISEGSGRCDEGTSRLREMARERSERVHRPAAKWTEEQTNEVSQSRPARLSRGRPTPTLPAGSGPPVRTRFGEPWLRKVKLLDGVACCSKLAISERPSSVAGGYPRGCEGVKCSRRWPGGKSGYSVTMVRAGATMIYAISASWSATRPLPGRYWRLGSTWSVCRMVS